MKMTSEAAIEAVLLDDGYTRVEDKGFDRERAIFPDEALAFVRTHTAYRFLSPGPRPDPGAGGGISGQIMRNTFSS